MVWTILLFDSYCNEAEAGTAVFILAFEAAMGRSIAESCSTSRFKTWLSYSFLATLAWR